MVLALTVEGGVRESDLGEGMNSVSPSSLRKAGTHTPRPIDFGRSELISSITTGRRGLWVPSFARTTRAKSAGPSNPAGCVLLHTGGHFGQPAARPPRDRPHAIHF